MNTYAVEIHANPGIYGRDIDGNCWTTFTLLGGRTIACSECGTQIDGGYVRGGRNDINDEFLDEDIWICCRHVHTQIGAHIDILTALASRIGKLTQHHEEVQTS